MANNVQMIKGFFPITNGIRVLNLFAYQSKGLPGLEIVGLGKLSRPLKEKLVYLTRKQEIKLPLKRYVLCVDLQEFTGNEKMIEDLRWLELPILFLFWTLGGILHFDQLEDCMASGKVMIDGSIICPQYPINLIENLRNFTVFSLKISDVDFSRTFAIKQL